MEPWIYNIQFEIKGEISQEIKDKVIERYPPISIQCARQRRQRQEVMEKYGRQLMKKEGIEVQQID